MRTVTTKKGDTLYVVGTAELEAARGWKRSHGGTKGRGACVMHGGDNPTAMEADFETGWVRCRTRGCVGRIAEHPDTLAGRRGPEIVVGGHRLRPRVAPAPAPRATPAPTLRPAAGADAALAANLDAWATALPGSRGEAYLRERGISVELAQAVGIGWGGAAGPMRGRVVFPLTDPTGRPTSATGRDATGGGRPKYWTLPADTHPKSWLNGGAVARAREDGLPLYVCEGPVDALALLAGGIGTAVAVLGMTGVRAEWLAGVPRVVVCFDGDDAGRAGAVELAFAAAAVGAAVELMPPAMLGDCKDLGEHWATHRALPDALVAHWQAAQAAPGPEAVPVAPATAGATPRRDDAAATTAPYGDDERVAAWAQAFDAVVEQQPRCPACGTVHEWGWRPHGPVIWTRGWRAADREPGEWRPLTYPCPACAPDAPTPGAQPCRRCGARHPGPDPVCAACRQRALDVLAAMSDDELAQYRRELDAAPADDPPAPDELDALDAETRRRRRERR